MSFRPVSENAFEELNSRKDLYKKLGNFGVKFLDDALIGVLPSDLILIGAPPGVGKTQFCCNMALSNISKGKRVHYIALEAEQMEIERRLKYQIISRLFFGDPNRPQLESKLSFDRWYLGFFLKELWSYELIAAKEMIEKYQGLFLFYKGEKFGLVDLIEQVTLKSEDTDLIIVDHVHYFDFDDENENRAMKEIAKMVRTLALENKKPIVLVAHLRKKDRGNTELVAGMEEFHGSSDLYKIATKVITFSAGGYTNAGEFETFFRIPKNRLNGAVTRFTGRTFFSAQKGSYEDSYKLGSAEQSKQAGFKELEPFNYPEWAKGQVVHSSSDPSGYAPKPGLIPNHARQGASQDN